MRQPNAVHVGQLKADSKEPKYVVEIEFDPSNILTFIKGADTTPAWPTGTVQAGTVGSISSTSQQRASMNRTTVGDLTIELVDISARVSASIANEQANNRELGDAIVRVFVGFEGQDPTYFEPVVTQRVHSISGRGATFTVKTKDVSARAKRKIFRLNRVQCRGSFSATDTTIPVTDGVAAFELLEHGSYYTDAPSQTVGYIKVQDEIIRYTGRTTTTGANAFTGCTRGVFGTAPQAYQHDPNSEAEEVVEFVYFEMSVIAAAQAVLTGYVTGTISLPSNWHAGLDRTGDLFQFEWLRIGADIFNGSDPSLGMQVRVWNVENVDAKAYCERELFTIAGCFMFARSDGRLGLRRVNAVLANAPYDFTLDVRNVLKAGPLRYTPEEVRNVYRLEWHKNASGDITRRITFVDSDSVNRYGERDPVVISMGALHGSVTSASSLFAVKNTYRERLSQAPLRISIEARAEASVLEVGDKVRVNLPNVRDPVGTYVDPTTPPPLDRTFEVQRVRMDWRRMRPTVELLAVSREPPPVSDCADPNVLADGFYNLDGTDLQGVASINSDVLDADVTLNGDPDMGASSAIYYYLGDLTIAAGVTVDIDENVQLRIRGTLTVLGTIRGTGAGIAAPTDPEPGGGLFTPGVAAIRSSPAGTVGYLGTTQAGEGIVEVQTLAQPSFNFLTYEYPAPVASSGRSGVDLFRLTNGSTVLVGGPRDLRGTSGAPGQHWYDSDTVAMVDGFRQYLGGVGGAGGSGLLIVCRGMVFGGAGNVVLDGGDGQPLVPTNTRPGGGGGGAPGACVVFLDGPLVAIPTFNSTTFSAQQGVNAASGAEARQDLTGSAFRVQFVPCYEPPVDDRPALANPFIGSQVSLTGQTDPQEERTHVTASGKIALRVTARAFISSPTGQNLLRVTVERKLTSEAVGLYVVIWDLDEEQVGYHSHTTLGGDLALGVDRILFDRDLVPESYDYRVTMYYELDSTPTAIPDGELDLDSWDC